ncbi:MAG TPA: Fic family protein [Sphingomonas sp.]|jgi:Fic family protein|uniref:Fic family protein n=1 Tax=Sphingomonas sp. TaxID=28214 RepID=UPI002ED99A48
MSIEETTKRIDALKAELATMRPLPPSALAVLREKRDLQLTHTSNAIEGNTLTLRETAEVIAYGTTIKGKPIKHHLEAQDHHAALEWMYAVASGEEPIGVSTLLQLHKLVLKHSAPDIAGAWAVLPRGIQGTSISFPPAFEVEGLTRDFTDSLKTAEITPRHAFDAHYRLVSIHPFDDGNGRTARLLMNLMLVRGGYQPVPVSPDDRIEYLDSLERAQKGGGTDAYQELMHRLLLTTMEEYAGTLREAIHPEKDKQLTSSPGRKADDEEPGQILPTPAQIAAMHHRRGTGR